MSSAAHDFGGLMRQQVIYHVDTLPFLPQTVQAQTLELLQLLLNALH